DVEGDRQRNIQLMKERSWVDVPVVYRDRTLAILAVEKAPLGARALAMLESPAERLRVASPPPAPAAPDRAPLDAVLKYAALSSTQPGNPVRPLAATAVPQVPARPLWWWPPVPVWWSWMPVWWSWMPWSLIPSWTWQLWSQTELPGTIRLASTTVMPMAPKPPSWLQAMSVVTTATVAMPPWPRVRAPDFRIPRGPSRCGREDPAPAAAVRTVVGPDRHGVPTRQSISSRGEPTLSGGGNQVCACDGRLCSCCCRPVLHHPR